jgi:hypothetical protein
MTATLTIELPLREDCDADEVEEEYEDEIQMIAPLASMDYFAQGGGRNWRASESMELNTGGRADGFVGSRLWSKTHDSSIEYFLGGQFDRFTGSVALDHATRSTVTRVIIRVFGDGGLIFESHEITAGYLPQDFNLYVGGITVLRFEIEHLSGTDWINAGFADAVLHRKVEIEQGNY